MDVLNLLQTLETGREEQCEAWNNFSGAKIKTLDELQERLEAFDTGYEVEKTIGETEGYDYGFKVRLTDFLLSSIRAFNNLELTEYGTRSCENTTIMYAPTLPCKANLSRAFSGCSYLTYIEPIDISNSTDLGLMFDGCTSLRSLPDNFLPKSTASLFGTFRNCKSLEYLPENFAPNETTNTYYLFNGCKKLREIPANFCPNSSLQTAAMFGDCNLIETLPENFAPNNTQNVVSMFGYCYNLKSIGKFTPTEVLNGSHMFYSCNNLESLPEGFAINVTNAYNLFANCHKLTDARRINISGIQHWGDKPTPQLPITTNSVGNIFQNSAVTHCIFFGEYNFDFDIDLTVWGFQNLDEESIVSFVLCLQEPTHDHTIKLTTRQKNFTIDLGLIDEELSGEETTLDEYVTILGYNLLTV